MGKAFDGIEEYDTALEVLRYTDKYVSWEVTDTLATPVETVTNTAVLVYQNKTHLREKKRD